MLFQIPGHTVLLVGNCLGVRMGKGIHGPCLLYTSQYRIVKKPAFRVVGVSHELAKELENNYEVVPNLWRAATDAGTIAELAAHSGLCEPSGLLGISIDVYKRQI